jgi:hypothetical protein
MKSAKKLLKENKEYEWRLISEHTRFLSVICIIGVLISKFIFDNKIIAVVFAILFGIVVLTAIYMDYKLNIN